MNSERIMTSIKTATPINNYLFSMSNLYGRLPASVVFELIKKYDNPALKEKDFLRCLKKLEPNPRFFIYSQTGKTKLSNLEIINSYFESMVHGDKIFTEKYSRLVDSQEENKNHFYIPKKSELLEYESELYFEDSSELNLLIIFVKKHLKRLSFTPSYEDIALDILSPLKTESSLDETLLNLSRIINFSGDPKKDKSLIEKILELSRPVYETTRMWHLCGHAPKELTINIK
ncbi:hypothetical protein IJI70_03105 [Candidatus Saccharibacteria bacterium]|nr:hypothetical protein [Candidatus Saccharibacteria bacterium]